MLTIRKGQMNALAAALDRAFLERMACHLREDFPAELAGYRVPTDQVDSLVERGVQEARQYGVVNQEDLQFYIECLMLLGPEFDRDPRFAWAGEILRRTWQDGRAKMDEISEHLLFGGNQPA